MCKIIVYKTDLKNRREAVRITADLQSHFPETDISFHLDDCDKVLRIESFDGGIDGMKIKTILEENGYNIEQLAVEP
jgi:hypothetical protein